MRLIAVATAVFLLLATSAAARTTTTAEENDAPQYVSEYNEVYWNAEECQEKEHAVWKQGDPKSDVKDGIEQMEKCLAWEPYVPPAPTYTETETTTETNTTSTDATGGYAIPEYIVECESGGDAGAVNPETGASGTYQIMPEHFEPGGACYGLSEYDCAARLWDGGAGASNWSQCL
jgi:hypothetical protein